ncbi:hypothetical protein [Micromonospora pisi]|uniref:hypothetical protein n=1 Tax=Micromonospora pisi TaxID=589240 RepID=UPI000EAF6F42|nr:hypothetical protein [Micromonospora pisi]
MRARRESLAAMFAAGSFRLLASTAGRRDVDLNFDSLFEFGLQRLLDGLAPLLPERQPGR